MNKKLEALYDVVDKFEMSDRRKNFLKDDIDSVFKRYPELNEIVVGNVVKLNGVIRLVTSNNSLCLFRVSDVDIPKKEICFSYINAEELTRNGAELLYGTFKEYVEKVLLHPSTLVEIINLMI